jgi:restriction system protein
MGKIISRKSRTFRINKKGHYQITEKGLKVLSGKPAKIDVKYLRRFPEFIKFKTRQEEEKKERSAQKEIPESLNPEELLEEAYKRIKSELIEDLLKKIKEASPQFFEKVVVELLVKMGHGGSRKDAGQAIGQSGDQGIDGIIKEDRLGLDRIYIQAKRWESTVGRPEIQKFVGALKGQGANKGIFISTSNFSNDALGYADQIDSPKIVLIDGFMLAELLIEHNVGVSEVKSYAIKKIDVDYFDEV